MDICVCDKCGEKITNGSWHDGVRQPDLRAHTGKKYHYCEKCYSKVFDFLTSSSK